MSLKKATISNVKWSFVEALSLKAVGFVLSIILARLLDPNAFGVLAIVNVFYLLTTLFIDAGLKEALIQKSDITEEDYSSVFWLNIGKSCLLYLGLFIAAPYIEHSYGYQHLSFYIRLQSLTLIIEAFGLVQIIKATKELNLKKITLSRVPASIISFLFGITLAYYGFGIVSLIVQQLINVFIYSLLLVLNVRFKPQFIFNIETVLPLYKFGVKLLGVSLISRFYTQSLNLIYAKAYTPGMLGLYTKATSLQNVPVEIINSSFLKGVYPTLVRLQNDSIQLKKIILQNTKLVTFLILLINGILYFQAYEIILILLGEKWLGMQIYLKIAAIGSVFLPMNGQCQSIFKVKNKVNLFFKIELVSKVIGLILIFSLISYCSLPNILILILIITLGTSICYFYFTSIFINFSFMKEFSKLLSLVFVNYLCGLLLIYLLNIFLNDIDAIFKVLTFSIAYVFLASFFFFILNMNLVKYLFATIASRTKK